MTSLPPRSTDRAPVASSSTPLRQGVAPDYISAFACTGGIGCHEQRQKFEEKGEIDQAILLEAGQRTARWKNGCFCHAVA